MSIKSYKGFKNDMTCRGFQYAENKSYENSEAICCLKGFHACEFPIDTFYYYPPATSIYHVVEQDGDLDRENKTIDTKIASSKITIREKLTIRNLVDASIEFIKNKKGFFAKLNSEPINCSAKQSSINSIETYYSANKSMCSDSINATTGARSVNSSVDRNSINSSTGYISANSAIEIYSSNSSTGNSTANLTEGLYSTNSSTGDSSGNFSTECCSINSSTGWRSSNSSTGFFSINSSTGNMSQNISKGYGVVNVSTGFDSSNSCEESSINIGWGRSNKCKGAIGSYLVLSEWGEWDGEKHPLLCAKMEKVDGVKIKADTWYKLINGEFMEVSD